MSLTAIISFLIVFGLLVAFHEFGHFIVAKKTGVLVREFAIGMGPKIFSWYQNHTAYTIRLLPVGGYVRMASEDDHDELEAGQRLYLKQDDKGLVTSLDTRVEQEEAGFLFTVDQADLVDDMVLKGFRDGSEELETLSVSPVAVMIGEDGQPNRVAPRAVWLESAKPLKRLAINLAGPFMNFVLAFIAAFGLAFSLHQVSVDQPVLGQVVKEQPAAKAGLKVNDRITSVNGHKVTTFTGLANELAGQADKDLPVTYERNGHKQTTTVRPEAVEVSGKKVAKVGIVAKGETSIGARMDFGWNMTSSWFTQVGRGIVDLFTSTFSLNKLGGPVMLAKATSTASNQGFLTVLALLGMLSVNLGLLNLLPIPPLDGGKVFLDLYESIFKRPFPAVVANALMMAGTILLVILMILVTAKDLIQF
ncbi:site-2 protease family protein [Fructobacillus sp. M2-14]|uniref:Site-2 protease family protein n=1 Tax=Fructobacillus broussonetiae TaxID=2713173 RepID=A0ABS5QYH2_9LACO|nr:M50 family metallopeptidase [Fructobacillus broussonetiae]MBS9338032.1 site-2 protease family protein [Fructobacillus broussonetiae]